MSLLCYNYVTHQYEASNIPETDEKALQFIPQLPAAQSMFDVCRKMGDSIPDAMLKVLLACVGEPIITA